MGVPELVTIAAMLVANGVFAAYELALASVSLGRLRMMAEQRRPGAAAALAMKDRMEASLAVVQIGITLVGAIAAATGGAWAEESFAPWFQTRLGLSRGAADVAAIGLVVLPLSAVTIIAGELVPKSVAIRNSEWVCLGLSPAMRVFALVVYPAVLTFEWVTKALVRVFERRLPADAGTPYEVGLAELQAQARALRASRIIGAEQERIIMGSSALNRVKAGDVLVPAEDIVMLNADGPLAEHIVAIHLDGYSRFPVTEKPGDPQGIIGYVSIKDILLLAQSSPEGPSLRRILRPLPEVPPEVTIGKVFSQMMQEHVHLVSVTDAGGTVRGILTLEDILEEIVGDIQDEHDRLPRRVVPSGRSWIVGGGVTLGQLSSAIGGPAGLASAEPALAFTEWLQRQTPERLKGGTVVTACGLRVLVRKMHHKRVMEALVSTESQPAASAGT
jgi:putative hemolysin